MKLGVAAMGLGLGMLAGVAQGSSYDVVGYGSLEEAQAAVDLRHSELARSGRGLQVRDQTRPGQARPGQASHPPTHALRETVLVSREAAGPTPYHS